MTALFQTKFNRAIPALAHYAPRLWPEVTSHPRGLRFLVWTIAFERFAYYGMRALLTLYMVDYLFKPDIAGQVIGLQALKRAFETFLGPLNGQPLASWIYGAFSGLVYLSPVVGGLIADRWLGLRPTVVIGALLTALGYFMLAYTPLFLFALVPLVLGDGALKPNLSTHVGELYLPGDRRRQPAYSNFYWAINFGAFLGTLVCGFLGQGVDWKYGFIAAGFGMLTGLAIYRSGWTELARSPHRLRAAANGPAADRRPLDRGNRRNIIAFVVLFISTSLFWTTYFQDANTIQLWADQNTDRAVNLIFWNPEIVPAWFLLFNPLMIVAFTQSVVRLWARQRARGREPSTLTKMAIGCTGVCAAYLILATAAFCAGPDKASWLWLFAFYAIFTIGELYISPVGLSLVYELAPVRLVAAVMGVWLTSMCIGYVCAGYLGTFWSTWDKSHFFLMNAAIAFVAGGLIWAVSKTVGRNLVAETLVDYPKRYVNVSWPPPSTGKSFPISIGIGMRKPRRQPDDSISVAEPEPTRFIEPSNWRGVDHMDLLIVLSSANCDIYPGWRKLRLPRMGDSGTVTFTAKTHMAGEHRFFVKVYLEKQMIQLQSVNFRINVASAAQTLQTAVYYGL